MAIPHEMDLSLRHTPDISPTTPLPPSEATHTSITTEQIVGYWGQAIDDLADGQHKTVAKAAVITIVELAKSPKKLLRTAGFFGVEKAQTIVTALDLIEGK